MSNFRVDVVRDAKSVVDKATTWASLEGRAFGPESPYPLKIFIGTGGDAWTEAWQEGCQEYAENLSARKRKKFAEQCQNPATMPHEALALSNRKAIERSRCLKKVAWRGPEFSSKEDLERWISGEFEYLLKGEPVDVPDGIRDLYELDGKIWRVPVLAEPPALWVGTKEQVRELMAMDIFNVQVGNARRGLEEDGAEGEADDLGNSPHGLMPKRRGNPSPEVSE